MHALLLLALAALCGSAAAQVSISYSVVEVSWGERSSWRKRELEDGRAGQPENASPRDPQVASSSSFVPDADGFVPVRGGGAGCEVECAVAALPARGGSPARCLAACGGLAPSPHALKGLVGGGGGGGGGAKAAARRQA